MTTDSLRLNCPAFGGSFGELVTAYRLNGGGKDYPPLWGGNLEWGV
jgi:hypothetical protein